MRDKCCGRRLLGDAGCCCGVFAIRLCKLKGGYTLVTLPRTVTLYRDSVDERCDRVTYKKLVMR